MNRIGGGCFSWYLLTGLWLALAGSHARADEEPAAAPPLTGQGNDAFRFLLKSLGLEPISNPNELSHDQDQTILIVWGNTDILEQVPGELQNFFDKGGAVLVATDRNSSKALDETFGVRVVGKLVRETRRDRAYKELEVCPLVARFESQSTLFQGMNGRKVATNRPGYLELHSLRNRRSTVLARFPEGCIVEGLETSAPIFAVTCARGKGSRALILSDHSGFINSMMVQNDNDNFIFAFNSIQWLMENGKRKKVLFVDEGEIVSDLGVKFSSGMPPLDLPVRPADLMNTIVAAAEEDDIFNRIILTLVPHKKILSAAAFLFTAAVLVFGFYRLTRARHRLSGEG